MIIKQLTGVYSIKENRFACVRILNADGSYAVEYGEIMVSSSRIKDVFDGDTVEVAVRISKKNMTQIEKSQGWCIEHTNDKPLCKIINIIRRKQSYIIGNVIESNDKVYIMPDSYLPFRVQIHPKSSMKCNIGDKVVADICKYKALSAIKVMPTHNFGSSEERIAVINSILYDTHAEKPFSEEIMNEIAEADKRFVSANMCDRADLRSMLIFTMSISLSAGLQRAFSLDIVDNRYRLGIHITDIAEYIKPGSALDREAKERNIAFLPRENIANMLPPELIKELALTANNDRLAVTLFLTFDMNGAFKKLEICESVVNIAVNGTFGEIDALLIDSDHSSTAALRDKYLSINESINLMYELAAKINSARVERGGIDINPQKYFHLEAGKASDNGSLTEFPEYDSMLIVKEFIIEAGMRVADYFKSRKIPGVYTAFCVPANKMTEYGDLLLKILDGEGSNQAYGFNAFFSYVTKKALLHKDKTLLLRFISFMFPSSYYSSVPKFHFLHFCDQYMRFQDVFTRYADIVNLRQLKRTITDSAELFSDPVKKEIAEVVGHSTQVEEKRKALIKKLSDLQQIHAMENSIGKLFKGTVARVTESATEVLLDNTVYCKMLGGSKTKINVADRVKIKMVSCSFSDNSIIAELHSVLNEH